MFKLFVQRQTSYGWNRRYLFFTSITAIITPLISINALHKNLPLQSLLSISPLDQINKLSLNVSSYLHSFESSFAKTIFILLFMGMLWGLTRIAFGLYIIYQLKKNAEVYEVDKIKFYFHSSIEIPFSFFNTIFVPSSFQQNENLAMIAQHENAHIKLNHSYSKLYFSCMQALFWFIPFIYLFHHDIDLQHEYEADELSLQTVAKIQFMEKYFAINFKVQAPTLLVHGYYMHPYESRIDMLQTVKQQQSIQKILLIIIVVLIILLSVLFQSI